MAEIDSNIKAQLEQLDADLITGIIAQYGQMVNDGIAPDIIGEQIITDSIGGVGIFSGYSGPIIDKSKLMQNREYENGQSNYLRKKRITPDTDELDLRMWNAVGKNSCPTCVLERHGEIKTYKEWRSIGLPGRGATICRHNCRCTLLPVETAKDLYDAKNLADLTKKAQKPVVIRVTQINKEMKRRGVDYSEAQFNSRMGDFRSRYGNLSDIPQTSVLAERNVLLLRKKIPEFLEGGIVKEFEDLKKPERTAAYLLLNKAIDRVPEERLLRQNKGFMRVPKPKSQKKKR